MTELLSDPLAIGRLLVASGHRRLPLHSCGPSLGGHPGRVCEAVLAGVDPRDRAPRILRRAPRPFFDSFIPLGAQVAGYPSHVRVCS